ncbi:adenylosuccinate lyase [Candidatus Bathyarchaeota archaeon]|nr:adenylosuccinate lyase [Candidatus Bathyarchaeota archaeon]
MPILPIDTGRYGTPEMKKIFEEETRVQRMLDVEAALAWAHAEVGDIPREDAEKIAAMASTKHVKLSRIKEIEREIKHDIASLVRALAEACGPSGAYVHLGATSSDIIDTATALQLREALRLIEKRMNEFERVLIEKSLQYKDTLMTGRTHGQHALPITLGFKFAVWMREISRHIQRLRQCKKRVLVGKMTGAVGVQAGLGPHAMKIQELVMQRLGIKSAEISTQIVQRDRHAELVCLLAMIASTLDNFATEIRELQRPEIGELFEPFDLEKRVGSSTMPHKRDPETCETTCGLAKIVRSLVFPALENVKTWHERDLTQSSAERFINPEACILIDHMLFSMSTVVANLYVDEQRMLKNIELTQGRSLSEAVMIVLTKKGVSRQEAHERLRKLAIKSKMEKRYFREILLKDEVVSGKLSEREIDEALNPRNYLGTALEQVELMVKKTREEREVRGLA